MKSEVFRVLTAETNPSGFDLILRLELTDPLAILALSDDGSPTERKIMAVAAKLEPLLSGYDLGQLNTILRWAVEKNQQELIFRIQREMLARIERVDHLADEFPDWLIPFSSGRCSRYYDNEVRRAALEKLKAIKGGQLHPAGTTALV